MTVPYPPGRRETVASIVLSAVRSEAAGDAVGGRYSTVLGTIHELAGTTRKK